VIGRLAGTLLSRGVDGTCIVDVGGVGYEVVVPLGALGRLPADGHEVALTIHTHVREDALVLYGFATPEDREAFRALLSVSQVGPKLAMAILSVLDARALARAVAIGDRAAFKGIAGVGKKTVERVLLDLKDKPLGTPSSAGQIAAAVVARAMRPPTDPLAVVAGALVSMGYKPSEADRAVAVLEERGRGADGADAQTLLREALGALG
jgi:Holliday junction DNA helicase RuvA